MPIKAAAAEYKQLPQGGSVALELMESQPEPEPEVQAADEELWEDSSDDEAEADDDDGDDVPAPMWFEHWSFAMLNKHKMLRGFITVLLACAPVLTSAGSILEVVYGCPTITAATEGFFAFGMFCFSFVWMFLFNSLCRVVRGADKNEARLEDEKELAEVQDLINKESAEARKAVTPRMRATLLTSVRAKRAGQHVDIKQAQKLVFGIEVMSDLAQKQHLSRAKYDAKKEDLENQFDKRFKELLKMNPPKADEGAEPAAAPTAQSVSREATAYETDPLHGDAAENLACCCCTGSERDPDDKDDKNCCGRYPIVGEPRDEEDQNGPFTTLAFDTSPSGRERVKITRQRYNSLWNLRVFCTVLGALFLVVAVLITHGTVELLMIDFDLENHNVSTVAFVSEEIFFLEKGCASDYINRVYAILLLAVWTPSFVVASLVLPLWLMSLQLGSVLASDDVEDLIRTLDPKRIHKHFATGHKLKDERNWRRKVEMPGGNLVGTMDELSEWGSAMGVSLVGYAGFSLGLVPTAVAYKSASMVAVCVGFAFVPIFILMAPATVSSICDDMLDQLNDISFLGDDDHKLRCTHMRYSFTHLSRSQGLGFKMFSTVIDKRMLAKMAAGMASTGGAIITFLVAVGTRKVAEDDGSLAAFATGHA